MSTIIIIRHADGSTAQMHPAPDMRGWVAVDGEARPETDDEFFARIAARDCPADATWEVIDEADWREPPPSQAALLAHAAAARWRLEAGGTTWQGHGIATDRQTQAILTGLVVLAGQDPAATVPAWKLPDGTFIPLTAADVLDMARTVATHVQAAFALEAEAQSLVAGPAKAAGPRLDSFEAVDAFFAPPA